MSFLDLTSRETFASLDGNSNYDPFDIESAGGDILMMGVDILIYGLLLFLCEFIESSPRLRQMFHKAPSVAPTAYTADDDVEREKAEAIDASPEEVSVNVKGVRQVYASLEGCKRVYNTAVEDVYFNVHRRECFALLGVNGAGKTSVFRILTGEYSPTSGHAYIGGFNVLTQLRDARKLIGYCPQFDALTEQLTGFEHLDLYCIIKGIPKNRRTEIIDFTLRELDLEQYRNVRAGTYSGGNKRKLSVALALLGNPSVLFLDEPSAGMDPEARKKMWKVIGNLKRRNGSVILTTHSMEEVEALCDRLTIMVAGRLRCLGTPTQIKGKFGSGYEVEVKIATPTKEEIMARLQALDYRSPSNDRVTSANLREVLVSLRADFLYDQVCETGAGAAIYKQLQTEKFVTEAVLISWVFIEECGWAVYNMLKASFMQVTPIEHYLSFYKFKVEKQPDKSLGYLFSVLETNKEGLRILEYSVRQTSLEQIFNMFARQAEVSAMAALMSGPPQ
jgi:ATP-binding cassette subfamily A (ABC1) protein 3